jgi:hypothetical protein
VDGNKHRKNNMKKNFTHGSVEKGVEWEMRGRKM